MSDEQTLMTWGGVMREFRRLQDIVLEAEALDLLNSEDALRMTDRYRERADAVLDVLRPREPVMAPSGRN